MKIKVIKNPGPDLLSRLGALSWPVWKSPVTEFDWQYDEDETCLFLEGEVEVESCGQKIKISAGDLAVFGRGLVCRWRVLRPVRKHYSFSVPEGLLK